MRTQKNGIYICILLCCVTFILILMARFFPIIPTFEVLLSHREQINETVYDVSLGLFASAFVVLLISYGSYFLARKRNIALLKHFCNTYVTKMAVLVSLLQEADDTGKYKFDIVKFKEKLVSDGIVRDSVESILETHNEILMNVEFSPICRNNKKNREVFCLLESYAHINKAIQYFDCLYKLEHYNAYKAEIDDFPFDFTDKVFSGFLDMVFQSHGNADYKAFFIALQKIKRSDDIHGVGSPITNSVEI